MRSVLYFIYYLSCIFFILVLSYADKEDLIDGDEVRNICDVRRMFFIDDTRDVTAPLTLLFIAPLIYLVVKRRFRSLPLNIALATVVIFWLWRFFIRFSIC
jgi:hypothetical protein